MNIKPNKSLTAVIQSMGARVLIILLNAATGILTARTLHPVGRGELAAMAVWPNFLGSVMSLGLPSALIYYSRREEGQGSLFWASSLIAAIVGVIVTIAGIVVMPLWLSKYPPHTILVAQFLMVATPVGIFTAITRADCESRGDFFASNVSLCLTPLVSLTLLVSFQVVHGLTPTLAAIAYISGGVPVSIWLYKRVVGNIKLVPTNIISNSLLLLRFGIRSYGADLCGTLAVYADQVLVVRLLSAEAMGTYVVALSVSRMLNIVHTSVAAVLFPKVVALTSTELLAVTERAARTSTALTAVAGLILAFTGPFLLPLIYGRDYRGASLILEILLVEVVLTGATLVLTQAFMALARPGLVTILQSSAIFISIPLLLLWVPKFGVLGAASALLLASFARLVLTLVSFRWALSLPTPDLLPRMHEICTAIQQALSAVARELKRGRLQPAITGSSK